MRKCPVCGQSLADKGKLRTHVQSAHPAQFPRIYQQPRAAPAARTAQPRRRRQQGLAAVGAVASGQLAARNQTTRVVTGSDIVTSIPLSASARIGAVLLELDINPLIMEGTRLAAEARLWARWRPQSLTVRVVPSAGTFVNGGYILAWSPDNENLRAGLAAIRRTATMPTSANQHISATGVLKIPCTGALAPSQQWLFTHPEGREEDATHGRLYVVNSSLINNVTGVIQLTAHIDWSVQFSGPDIVDEELRVAVYAAEGWSPYFTTSDNDWKAGGFIGLKERSGGNMVQFTGLQPGVVYELDQTAKLEMWTSLTQREWVGYGVKIHDPPSGYPNCMTVFPRTPRGLHWAKQYAAKDDQGYLYAYHKAGEFVHPSNPAWWELSTASVSMTVHGSRGVVRTPPQPQQRRPQSVRPNPAASPPVGHSPGRRVESLERSEHQGGR